MNTEDRELLEMAAKAAGLEGYRTNYAFLALVKDKRDDKGKFLGYQCWNPLTDDGDALRLVVKLELELYFGDDEAGTTACVGYTTAEHANTAAMVAYKIEHVENDCASATRRAIVRAAAEIGQRMA